MLISRKSAFLLSLPIVIGTCLGTVWAGDALAADDAASPAPEGFPPAVCAAPPPPAAPLTKPSVNAQSYRPFPASWQKILDGLVGEGRVPGAVVIVKSPAWGVRVGTAGVADLASKAKISPDMQFRVGSVSKLFLALTVLQLEQEGRLRLTDPVLKHLGDNALVAGIPHIGDVTVGDLLQMKSGIANYLGAPAIGFSPQVTPDRHFDPEDLVKVLSTAGGEKPLPPDFVPKQTYPNPYWVSVFQGQPPSPAPAPYPFWYYSNSNYTLLGMIAEKVSGLKAEQVMQRYVMDRAGLPDTYLATDNKTLPHIHGYTKWGPIPYPHQVYNDWCDVTAVNPSYAWTAGGVVSTPWDLLKLGDAVFKSNTLLNQGTKEKWYTFVSSDLHIGWEVSEYGVGGLMQPHRAYGTARGHGGAFPGYKTLLYYFFDADTFFVLATNTWDQGWEVAMLDGIMPLVASAATTPRPKAGATGVKVGGDGTVDVSWQAGRVYGSSYTVFWGADAGKVDAATGLAHEGVQMAAVTDTKARLTAGRGQTLYWKVDTLAPDQATPVVSGPLWSFKTAK
ncbi:serine hydrolase domain-containing protein [Shumkonia mesophila]|uniref:serine hydrolase domain-containing protein n=1 Tax=Shumkonia mesophila TaxID=2838854 RepID=UPI0029343BC5|nr:serine hydrolase domain-containing protein [Shumkonia mesophila]